MIEGLDDFLADCEQIQRRLDFDIAAYYSHRAQIQARVLPRKDKLSAKQAERIRNFLKYTPEHFVNKYNDDKCDTDKNKEK